MSQSPPTQTAMLRAILDTVAFVHGVTADDLKGPARARAIVRPRQRFMYEAGNLGRWSWPQIGGFVNRDHTTAIHGARAHARRMAQR